MVARPSQIVSYAPNGTDGRWLGSIGPVVAQRRSYVLPGGCDQLQATLLGQPGHRQRAIDSGRIVKVFRGAASVWDGKMDEPTPTQGGWQVNAHGSGNFGTDFMAQFTTYNANNGGQAITNAIGRGLRWINPYASLPGSLYFGSPPDNASVTITDYLNGITAPVNFTWMIRQPWNTLQVFALPTAPTRILIATAPQARALFGYFNTIWLRYTATAQTANGGAAVFGTTSTQNNNNVSKHGPLETYADLSQAPAMTAAAAQAIGATQIARYQAANWAGPFTVHQGQYRNMGGTPVNLATEQAGEVVQLMLAAGGYGGEVVPAIPLTFIVGNYAWDEDAETATITPLQSVNDSITTLLGNWATVHTPPQSTGATHSGGAGG